ncbi:hypothetical protein A2U01_0079468, partial [Trifolium medium]|nr:hypothetical protein [Trifolium medium]
MVDSRNLVIMRVSGSHYRNKERHSLRCEVATAVLVDKRRCEPISP